MSTTLARLRKIVREDAVKLGHDPAYLCKVIGTDGLYTIECIHCGMWATINITTREINITDVDYKHQHITIDKIRRKDFRRNLSSENGKYLSGRTISDAHPPGSKGTISGALISQECNRDKVSQICLVH